MNNDFYRQALDLDLRSKREYTEAILSAMGGIDKGHFWHFKALLNLSDEAMELADRHSIDEKKLRYVLTLPPDFHGEIVRQIIDFNLSSAQVKALCESDGQGILRTRITSRCQQLRSKLPRSHRPVPPRPLRKLRVRSFAKKVIPILPVPA